MDNWKKYMSENEHKLSIEEVDDAVWQHVHKAVVPKKRSSVKRMHTALALFFKLPYSNNKKGATRRRKSTYKLAYTFIFFLFIAASFAFKVKGHAKYGDMVSFAFPKNTNLLNNTIPSNPLFASFTRTTSPADPGSYLFFKCIKMDNPDAKQMINNLKQTAGVSNLVVTPVVVEYKQSLFASFLSNAFEIELSKAKPGNKQVKQKIEAILKEKGLASVNVQVDDKGDVLFNLKSVDEKAIPDNTKDSVITVKTIIDKVTVNNTRDTVKKPTDGVKNLSGWKLDLKLMTDLTNALQKDGLVDNKKPYKLEIKDGAFYINDKKQSQEITEKYKKYFKNSNYTITNDGDYPNSTLNYSDAQKDEPKKGLSNDLNLPTFDPVQYKKDLKLMNQLIDGLHKDGLIDRNKPYTVQVKEGELYINGKKQPLEVSDKFRKYFQSNNYGFNND